MATRQLTLAIGNDASAIDITLRSNSALMNAYSVTFLIDDAASAPQLSGTATHVSTGYYQASGIIPSGTLGVWTITWTVTLSSGINPVEFSEDFFVTASNISASFETPGSDTDSLYEYIRFDLGDSDGIIFNDAYLAVILKKAIIYTNALLNFGTRTQQGGIDQLQFAGTMRVGPVTINLTTGTISPIDEQIRHILILTAEYIILKAEVNALKRLGALQSTVENGTIGVASSEGVEVRNADGVRVAISSTRFAQRVILHKLAIDTIKAELDRAIELYNWRYSSILGKGII